MKIDQIRCRIISSPLPAPLRPSWAPGRTFEQSAFKPFIPHTWFNGIRLGANLHLAAATPNCPWFEFPVDSPVWTEDSQDFMLAEPYTINADGTISVPDAPGFGFELEREAIPACTIHTWESDGSS